MIAWDESMSTGIPSIDIQHQNLIAKFNDLMVAIEEGRGREETGKILDYLQFYAEWHFTREEQCMAEVNCPVANANASAHKTFLKDFSKLYEDYHASNVDPDIVPETLNKLETWIVNHIKHTDTQLQHCVVGEKMFED